MSVSGSSSNVNPCHDFITCVVPCPHLGPGLPVSYRDYVIIQTNLEDNESETNETTLLSNVISAKLVKF